MAMLRSYLIDAGYRWLVEHDLTPYLLVDAEYDGVVVPEDFVEDDGKIVLNCAPGAIRDYECNHQAVTFRASFNGEVMNIYVPLDAVLGLYAEEAGQGLYMREDGYGIMVNEGDSEQERDPQPADDPHPSPAPGRGKGGLHLV